MPQAPVQDRSSWDVTMEPRLKKLFTYGLKENSDWEKAWNVERSDKMREEVAEYVTPDVVVETPEGAPYVTLSMSIVRTSSVVHIDYTGQVIFTHQMKRDKKYKEMEKQTWGLGEAMARKPHEMGVELMYNGFSSAKSSDGQPWFSNSHPLKNAPTLYDDNLISDAFGPEGLKNAMVRLMSTLNENGKPIPMGYKTLRIFVTPNDWVLAQQLAKENDWLPNSSNFNRNVFKIEPYVLPFLFMCQDSHRDTQWYVQDPMFTENTMFRREGPTYKQVTDPHTDNTLIQGRQSYSFLISGHRGTVGSKGLG